MPNTSKTLRRTEAVLEELLDVQERLTDTASTIRERIDEIEWMEREAQKHALDPIVEAEQDWHAMVQLGAF